MAAHYRADDPEGLLLLDDLVRRELDDLLVVAAVPLADVPIRMFHDRWSSLATVAAVVPITVRPMGDAVKSRRWPARRRWPGGCTRTRARPGRS